MQQKARFLILLFMALLILLPIQILYTVYIQLNNPLLNYAINWKIIGPEIGLEIVLALLFMVLVRGHYTIVAQATIFIIFTTIWSIMFIDRSSSVSRLDTIILILGVSASLPLFIIKRKIIIAVYAVVNIGMMYAYLFINRENLALPPGAFMDYLGDNTIAFVYTAIVAYTILSISNRAIENSAAGIEALSRNREDMLKTEAMLRESLKEKDYLLREIHHRVKNNMQVISSLLNMQAAEIGEPLAQQALRDAMGRIRSMASIHERMYTTGSFSRVDMAAYLKTLLRELVSLHSSETGEIQITHRMASLHMGIDKAIPLGLIINEIVTNSIKHGCRELDPCQIDLAIDETPQWIEIMIADHGPGMDPSLFTAARKSSMGMQIIDVLARQIKATVDLDVATGTRFIIRVPTDA